jgi:menaquinone-dependent protoporphyrinogen oxidase
MTFEGGREGTRPRPRRHGSGLSRSAIRAGTDAPRRPGDDPGGMALDHESLHELWRMQLLDELRHRRAALDFQPRLDPEGRRRAALVELIATFEDAELEALEELADKEPEGETARKGDVMRPTILVAYGSKKGSTAEVATFVGRRLRERGLVADVRRAAEVEDLAFYDGVVLGGSLYFGRWHDDAQAFLNRFGTALAGRPLAVFALGPKTTSKDDVAESQAQLDRALDDVVPTTVAVFGGVIDPTKLRFPFNRMPASDARDWTAIAAWADDVASLVARQEVTV